MSADTSPTDLAHRLCEHPDWPRWRERYAADYDCPAEARADFARYLAARDVFADLLASREADR